MKEIFVLLFVVTLIVADEADLQEFASSNKLFTGSIYKELIQGKNENILVSPFSVEIVLALTQSGAVGTTGEEIRKGLFLPDTKEKTETIIKNVLPVVLETDDYFVRTVNKIYVENGLTIKDHFKEIATDVYQAGFENIEFSESVEAAEEINAWVEEQTDNKILDLINPASLDPSTKLVLINTLYFQGNWSVYAELFSKKKMTFFTSNNDGGIEVDAIQKNSTLCNFYESTELDAVFLELPFEGRNGSMTIVLPKERDGIDNLEKAVEFLFATPKYGREYVKVVLPKFKIENTIDFKPILEKLGVNAAFDGSEADFSGIAGERGDLLISVITQKTFVDVNENGVEAAAATNVIVPPPSILPDPTQTVIADHPFVFYIKVNEIILFAGKVVEPIY